MGNLGAPEVSLKKTWVLGEPKRSNSLLLLQIFAESKPCAHVCTALDLPCFRHVALQNSGWKGEKASPLPSHPVIAATPPLLAPGARYPGPRFTAVTYSLARRCPPCGDLGGVGRGGGGRRCVSGDIGAPLKERSGPPAPLRRPSGPRLPPPRLVTESPSFCPCGPQPDTPAAALTPSSFPSGSEAPGVEEQSFPAPETSVSGSLGPLGGFHAKRALLAYFLDF